MLYCKYTKYKQLILKLGVWSNNITKMNIYATQIEDKGANNALAEFN